MHLRGQTTTFQTRLEISEHAAAGLNDTQIAERVRCSVWTVRKWRRRWRKLGHLGFTSQMGHPVTGPMSTFPHELQEAILHLRQLHPGWGPATLLIALKTDPRWYDRPLPSRARKAHEAPCLCPTETWGFVGQTGIIDLANQVGGEVISVPGALLLQAWGNSLLCQITWACRICLPSLPA